VQVYECHECAEIFESKGEAIDHLVDEHLTELLDIFEKEVKERKFNEKELIETFFDVYDVDEE